MSVGPFVYKVPVKRAMRRGIVLARQNRSRERRGHREKRERVASSVNFFFLQSIVNVGAYDNHHA